MIGANAAAMLAADATTGLTIHAVLGALALDMATMFAMVPAMMMLHLAAMLFLFGFFLDLRIAAGLHDATTLGPAEDAATGRFMVVRPIVHMGGMFVLVSASHGALLLKRGDHSPCSCGHLTADETIACSGLRIAVLYRFPAGRMNKKTIPMGDGENFVHIADIATCRQYNFAMTAAIGRN